MRAGGINLAPVINRASELANKLRRARLDAIDLKGEQERASDLTREIRSLGCEEAISAAKTAFPRLRPTEVHASGRWAEIIEALSAVLSDFSAVDGRTEEVASSDNLDRPSTKNEKILKTCRPEKANASVQSQTTPMQVRLLATKDFGEVIDLYAAGLEPGQRLSWRTLTMAAMERAHMIGITGDQWASSCALVGQTVATLGLLLVDRNSERGGLYHVENPAAAFSQLAVKEARDGAVVAALLRELAAFVEGAADA